jgi:uncharacterized protein
VTLNLQSRKGPAAFHMMIKPRGAVCNLSCAYCYYLPKERLYPGSGFRMSDALLETFTRAYIEAQSVPEVTFGWQGGEPLLMGLPFFRRALALQRQYRRPGMRINNTLQTNATLLDAEWCQFLREQDFLVGVSLDGPRALHDAHRVDRGGQPTFDRVVAGLELLQKHEVPFNILATVHAANAGHPLEVYRFFRDTVGAQFIQFIPIVVRDHDSSQQDGKRVSALSVTGRQYGAFLNAVFDEWVHRDVGRVFVQTFDAALAAWMGRRPGLCVFEPTCGTALVIEHNGDVYACDHFVEPEYRRGNIATASLADVVRSAPQRAFGQAKREALPHCCRECAVRFACNGGCPKNRLLCSDDGEPGLNFLCEGYKAFFTHIDRPMRMMAEELSAGRAPANVMLRLAREEVALQQQMARARRNDPCPCGSGKKFKYCHGGSGHR